MKKKLMLAVLAGAAMLAMTGCSSETKETEAQTKAQTETTAPETEAATEAKATEAQATEAKATEAQATEAATEAQATEVAKETLVEEATEAATEAAEEVVTEAATEAAEEVAPTEEVTEAVETEAAETEVPETEAAVTEEATEAPATEAVETEAATEAPATEVEATEAATETVAEEVETEAVTEAVTEASVLENVAEAISEAQEAAEEAVSEAQDAAEEAISEAQAVVEEAISEAGLEEAVSEAQEAVEEAMSEAVAEEAATEAATEATETVAEEAVEEATEEATEAAELEVMSYDQFLEAAVDDEVLVETYVQAKQGWWTDDAGVSKATVYTQNEEGGFFIYDMPMSEEEYDLLVEGQKIKVDGYKAEWSGEVEIADATFEIEDGNWVAPVTDVTEALGTDEIEAFMNQKVAFKGMTVEASTDPEGNEVAFLYNWDGSGEQGNDLYFNVSKDGQTYTFTVESYLCGADTEVYKAVEALNVGDEIDLEGFLYWYEGAQPHVTAVAPAQAAEVTTE